MADCDIFREQLAITYPTYGYGLWNPRSDKPVEVGDVGFIRWGKFHRLFNALLPAEDPSHAKLDLPEGHEPFVPISDHISKAGLSSGDYCSAGIDVMPELEFYSNGPDDFRQVSFKCPKKQMGAVLSLPVGARREDTLMQEGFGKWMTEHIECWFAFARGRGVKKMEEVILVTGCDHTRSWTNVAFLGNHADAKVSFGIKVVNTSINFQFTRGHVLGAVLNQGPEGTDLPEDQCVFIRGFRVARTLGILPKHLKAAADSPPGPGGHDSGPDNELISIPATTEYLDPLHSLLGYIIEIITQTTQKATKCDMVLLHDDDLLEVVRFGRGTSLDTLQPEVVMDLLHKFKIEIDTFSCTGSTSSTLSPNTDIIVGRVAKISIVSQNCAQNTGPRLASESSMPSSPTLLGSSALPTIRDDISVLSGTTYARDEEPYHDLRLQLGVVHGTPSKQPPEGVSGRPYHQQWTSNYTVFSPPASTALQLPVQPQRFNLTEEHDLPPQMPDARPYFGDRGRRRALIIGINYIFHSDPRFRLRYCVEDAYAVANFLRATLGFARENIRIMTDEYSPWYPPTKENILRAMRALIRDAQPHDSFFIYFSGHAVQIKDLDGDASDGLDECICAMDYLGNDPHPNPNTRGLIVDDIMHEIMVKPLPAGCRLTAIFDSWDSGTLLDLPYLYNAHGVLKEFRHPKRLEMLRQKSSYADVISLGATKDGRPALETNRGGALRRAFIECLTAFKNDLAYRELIQYLREDMIRRGIPQRPLLSSSHEIDTDLPFRI